MIALKKKVMVFITIVLGMFIFLPVIADLLYVYVRGSFRIPFLHWNHENASWVSIVAVILFFLLVFSYWLPRHETKGKERRRKVLETQFERNFGFVPVGDFREAEQERVNNALMQLAERLFQADQNQRAVQKKVPEKVTGALEELRKEREKAKQWFEEARGNFWQPHDCAEKMEFVVLPKYKMYLDPRVVAQTLIS